MDNDLQILNEVRMSSKDLCDLINQFRLEEGNTTKKEHNTLMRDIRKEIQDLENAGVEGLYNFVQSSYINSQNKEQPCFSINRDGALQILNKESALVRYKTIQYIDRLEKELNEINKPSYMIEDPIKRAERWIDEEKRRIETENKNKELEGEIEKNKPKIDWYEKFLNSEGTYTATQVGKLIGYPSAQKLNTELSKLKIQYRQGKHWIPNRNTDKEWYKLTINEFGTRLKWKPKGIVEISKILGNEISEENIKKIMEEE